MPKLTGARFIDETVHGDGLTHIFYMPCIMPPAMLEMGKLDVTAIQSHGKKAAAYMAGAYARVRRGPSLVMAQSVGAAYSKTLFPEPGRFDRTGWNASGSGVLLL